jgi:carboxymethylenebutenolidase
MANSTQRIQLDLPSGRTVVADLAKPASLPAGGIILFHEWWGLNDEMRAVVEKFAAQGFVALAVDLFEGESSNDMARARELMTGLDAQKATETAVAWVKWMRKAPECNGRVATLGYCLGGAWSLNTSLATPVDATVIYYGNVKKTPEELATLKGPVLAHFGKLDQAITPEMAEGFRDALKQAGKPGEVLFYDANHAFSRTGGPNYDSASAAMAEQRTLDFLHQHLD